MPIPAVGLRCPCKRPHSANPLLLLLLRLLAPGRPKEQGAEWTLLRGFVSPLASPMLSSAVGDSLLPSIKRSPSSQFYQARARTGSIAASDGAEAAVAAAVGLVAQHLYVAWLSP